MNAGDILHAVAQNLGDVPLDRYPPARIMFLAQRAQVAFNAVTKVLKGSYTLGANLAAGEVVQPADAPVAAAGGGTSVQFAYTYVVEVNGVVLLESNPSPRCATVTDNGVLTMVDSANVRVTHKYVYCTPDGRPTGDLSYLTKTAAGVLAQATTGLTIDTDVPLLVGGYPLYGTPSDLHLPQAVELDGLPLTHGTEDGMRALYADWRAERGTPRHWLYGRDGTNIRLVPAPDEVIAPVLDYIRNPSNMAITGLVDIPYAFADFVPHWVTAWICVQDNDYRDPSKAALHHGECDAILALAMGDTAAGMAPVARRVNRRLF